MSISTSRDPSVAPLNELAHLAPPLEEPRPKLWPAAIILAVFWAWQFIAPHVEMMTFVRWTSGMAVSVLTMIALGIWWFRNRALSRGRRWQALAALIAGGLVTGVLSDRSVMFTLIFVAPIWIASAGTAWLFIARGIRSRHSFAVLLTVICATWSYFTLIRVDGISGEQRATIHWRWTPTAESLYLETKQAPPAAQESGETASDGEAMTAGEGDWTGFRGPERDATVRGCAIATDWESSPPKQIWRQRVGPAWSSVVVIGDRLFTQEQRGEFEAVVCLDAETGREIWAHEDQTRFFETVAGAGPRATPTFADGRIYAAGATGLLNCLDARTGKRHWSRDFAKDSGAKLPMWGFCGSPLVVDDVAIVFAGGEGEQGLIAYHTETGEPAWQVATGHGSYSSPHLASFAGQPQILCLSDGGLVSVEPASGKVLWSHGSAAPGAPISLQPHPLGEAQLVIPSAEDFGVALLEVKREADSWSAQKLWGSRSIHPSFNDFVIHEGAAYGFDEAIFACFNIATGKRLWKGGRYGHGQVLLIADQGLLVIVAESGEVVLLKANPKQHEELCRFSAIEGKTWNHPALVRGRLFVRNAEEMACYDLNSP